MASEELRLRKLAILTECMDNYPFKGLEIDFCRHTPFLPPGRQWELREHVTEFMRMLRRMLLSRETNGRTLLLSARVPYSVEGCRADGLDIETWAEEGIVDALTLGSRSFCVDIEDFRRITKGRVKLYPCFDQHHTMDAYALPSMEVYRGVFSNHWLRGADGVKLFNWALFNADECQRALGGPCKFNWMLDESQRAFDLIGDIDNTLSGDKTYVIERKGGYPWEEGFANNNNTKPLPAKLNNRGEETRIPFYACDPIAARRDSVESLKLALVFYGLRDTDAARVCINGARLIEAERCMAWRDDEINAPDREYVSGYNIPALEDKTDRPLARLCFEVDPGVMARGENFLSVALKRADYPHCDMVSLEKAELTVTYGGFEK